MNGVRLRRIGGSPPTRQIGLHNSSSPLENMFRKQGIRSGVLGPEQKKKTEHPVSTLPERGWLSRQALGEAEPNASVPARGERPGLTPRADVLANPAREVAGQTRLPP